MLCEKCSNVHFRRLEDCELIKQEPERLLAAGHSWNTGELFYFHQPDRHTLEKSSQHGCHFCAMIFDRLFGDGHGFQYHEVDDGSSFAKGEVVFKKIVPSGLLVQDETIRKSKFERWNTEKFWTVECEDRFALPTAHDDFSGLPEAALNSLTDCENAGSLGTQRFSYKAWIPALDGGLMPSAEWGYSVFPQSSFDIGSNICSPWTDLSTTSFSNMILASFWLRLCMREHEACTDFQIEGILPNRIIDISDPAKPLLREGGNCKEHYVTLSYMWGTSRKYVTSKENLDQHMDYGIPLKCLPSTFEEAIFVARFLGFKWIWIDALCICQDDQDELISEIGKMDQIFRNSTLTIFAAAGKSADAGLKAIRDPRWIKPCKLKIKTTFEVNTAEGAAYFNLYEKPTEKPLYERGWVLQEQLMATRGLIFENRQIRWRCLCGYLSESHPSGKEPSGVYDPEDLTADEGSVARWRSDGFVKEFRGCIRRDNSEPDSGPLRSQRFDTWYSMVVNYNMRALTYVTDALPAIAGLASAMTAAHGYTYLAGLWKDDLQRGLCWYVKALDQPVFEKLDVTGLPSWSWVSQRDREIEFFHHFANFTFFKPADITIEENAATPTPTEKAVGLSLDASRSLTVFGRLRKLHSYLPIPYMSLKYLSRGERWARWEQPLKDPDTGEQLGSVAFDSDPSDLAPSLVYYLLCAAEKRDGYWFLTGLALTPTDESLQVFKRIGLVVITKQDWFGNIDNFESDRVNQGRKEPPLRRKVQII